MAANKIEEFLINLMYTYREIEPNFWILEDPEHSLEDVAVIYADPLVIIRVQVMDAPKQRAPKQRRLEFFTKLLELNASDLVQGSYGLDKEKVVLIDTHDYETLDYPEFKDILDAFSLSLTQHYPVLSEFRDKVESL